jgi:hypothetical protein
MTIQPTTNNCDMNNLLFYILHELVYIASVYKSQGHFQYLCETCLYQINVSDVQITN